MKPYMVSCRSIEGTLLYINTDDFIKAFANEDLTLDKIKKGYMLKMEGVSMPVMNLNVFNKRKHSL
jgi:hypothetical protein